jgi:hypothetical protein
MLLRLLLLLLPLLSPPPLVINVAYSHFAALQTRSSTVNNMPLRSSCSQSPPPFNQFHHLRPLLVVRARAF